MTAQNLNDRSNAMKLSPKQHQGSPQLAAASGRQVGKNQTFATMMEPLVPPKPKEFDITMRITASRASLMMLTP